jgi:hypothetical protein
LELILARMRKLGDCFVGFCAAGGMLLLKMVSELTRALLASFYGS